MEPTDSSRGRKARRAKAVEPHARVGVVCKQRSRISHERVQISLGHRTLKDRLLHALPHHTKTIREAGTHTIVGNIVGDQNDQGHIPPLELRAVAVLPSLSIDDHRRWRCKAHCGFSRSIAAAPPSPSEASEGDQQLRATRASMPLAFRCASTARSTSRRARPTSRNPSGLSLAFDSGVCNLCGDIRLRARFRGLRSREAIAPFSGPISRHCGRARPAVTTVPGQVRNSRPLSGDDSTEACSCVNPKCHISFLSA